MEFRLPLLLPSSALKLSQHNSILLIGSCFTENIGNKLNSYLFDVHQNPHGILFNPISVSESLQQIIDGYNVQDKNLFCLNEAWHNWDFHSRYSAPSAAQAAINMNTSILNGEQFLKKCDTVMITLGSAWIYELTAAAPAHNSSGVAANNHKANANWFAKRLFQQNEIVATLQAVFEQLVVKNPAIQIILTVSPVRHVRDGYVDNNRSKATLLLAVHQLVEAMQHVHYFPAYEFVIDDLRDYRFYADDMVHPNYMATNYVWDKFCQHYFSKDVQALNEQINTINAAMAHRPFNAASKAHNDFKKAMLHKVNELAVHHPHVNLSVTKAFFA